MVWVNSVPENQNHERALSVCVACAKVRSSIVTADNHKTMIDLFTVTTSLSKNINTTHSHTHAHTHTHTHTPNTCYRSKIAKVWVQKSLINYKHIANRQPNI